MIQTEPLLLIMAAGNLWLVIIAMGWLTSHIVAASYTEPPATMIMTERPEQHGPCIHRRNTPQRTENRVAQSRPCICSIYLQTLSHTACRPRVCRTASGAYFSVFLTAFTSTLKPHASKFKV
jgi:hypothetical protein